MEFASGKLTLGLIFLKFSARSREKYLTNAVAPVIKSFPVQLVLEEALNARPANHISQIHNPIAPHSFQSDQIQGFTTSDFRERELKTLVSSRSRAAHVQ